jgi:hypothetical protein
MITAIRCALLTLVASATAATAEPQGGFPAQRERSAQAQSQQEAERTARANEIQRRQNELDKRDQAITRSICKGC